MGSSELYALPAVELARRVRARALSPVELTDAHIARIEAVNPHLNAVVAQRFEAAREEAKAAEERLMHVPPEELPPFFGVPCTIKELIAVRGKPGMIVSDNVLGWEAAAGKGQQVSLRRA